MTKAKKPAPPGKKWIFCKAYRNKRIAAEYGLECWSFLVDDT